MGQPHRIIERNQGTSLAASPLRDKLNHDAICDSHPMHDGSRLRQQSERIMHGVGTRGPCLAPSKTTNRPSQTDVRIHDQPKMLIGFSSPQSFQSKFTLFEQCLTNQQCGLS